MIILASQSKARQTMLKNAGLEFKAIPADLDEQSIIESHKGSAGDTKKLASILAEAKAKAISAIYKDALIIGSDQILECEGTLFSKATTKDEAKQKLQNLSGKTHHLISAVAVVKNGETLWQGEETAALTMHDFDEAFIDKYCARAGDALTRSVGAYELEALGVHLFEKIEGDYFTILGMPLLKLLTYLRKAHGTGL